MRHRRGAEALLAAVLLLTGAPALAGQDDSRTDEPAAADKPPLALFGTIPIYWGEGDGMEDVLAGTATAHWARALLEQHHALHPLATLLAEDLADQHALLIAQPRVLNPAENVALDQWVRAGGRLLLFADPLLSAESIYPLGDRRRPQNVVLLSPLLRHWGLDLRFAADQAPTRQVREIAGMLLPHQLSGTFAALPGSTGCVLQGAEILADCRVGEGRVVILADAALLDLYHPAAGADEALLALAQRAFDSMDGARQNNDLANASRLQPVDKAVQNNPQWGVLPELPAISPSFPRQPAIYAWPIGHTFIVHLARRGDRPRNSVRAGRRRCAPAGSLGGQDRGWGAGRI